MSKSIFAGVCLYMPIASIRLPPDADTTESCRWRLAIILKTSVFGHKSCHAVYLMVNLLLLLLFLVDSRGENQLQSPWV